MIWERVEADWGRFKVNAKQRWDKLSEQQLNAIGGRRAVLARRIGDTYSLSMEEAERQLADWQAGLALLPPSPR
jgi:hypothetical protein